MVLMVLMTIKMVHAACCPSAKGLVLGVLVHTVWCLPAVLVHTAWCLLGVLVHWSMVFAVSQRKRRLRVELCSYLQEHLYTWAAIYTICTIWFLYLPSSIYCNTICSLVPSLLRGPTMIMLPCRSIAWFDSYIHHLYLHNLLLSWTLVMGTIAVTAVIDFSAGAGRAS